MSRTMRLILVLGAMILMQRPAVAAPTPARATNRQAVADRLRLHREHVEGLKQLVLGLRERAKAARSEPERMYWQAQANHWTRELIRLMRIQGRLERQVHRHPRPGAG